MFALRLPFSFYLFYKIKLPLSRYHGRRGWVRNYKQTEQTVDVSANHTRVLDEANIYPYYAGCALTVMLLRLQVQLRLQEAGVEGLGWRTQQWTDCIVGIVSLISRAHIRHPAKHSVIIILCSCPPAFDLSPLLTSVLFSAGRRSV